MRPVYLHMTQFAQHKLHILRDRWAGCQKCDLCKIRHKIVHIRGNLPSTIAFIGEAPGESEDIVGYPFVGTAGKLFDEMWSVVHQEVGPQLDSITYSLCNIVACYPGKDDRGNFNKPHKFAVKECEPHLRSLLEIAQPRLIVTLGEVASKKLPADLKVSLPYLNLAHPSSISRTKDPREYTLKYRRFILCLSHAIREYLL